MQGLLGKVAGVLQVEVEPWLCSPQRGGCGGNCGMSDGDATGLVAWGWTGWPVVDLAGGLDQGCEFDPARLVPDWTWELDIFVFGVDWRSDAE